MSKNKNILIGLLCLVVLIMMIAYAGYQTALKINGTSSISSTWKIVITNIVQKELSETTIENNPPTYTSLNANFDVSFEKPGDYATYTITVENQGTLNAVLDSIIVNLEETDVVTFKVDGISSKDPLNAGKSKEFDITFKYNEEVTTQPDQTNYNVSLDLNYLQEGNSTNFSDATEDTIDTLSIQDIKLTASETTIRIEAEASNAVKYYFSLDNDKYYESLDNTYIFSDLNILTRYTIWVKAEDSEGNVVITSKEVTTVDVTSPSVKIEEKAITKGENDYNLGVTLTGTVSDNGYISKVLYCVTTENECTPNIEITLSDAGTFDYAFATDEEAQKICIKALDSAGNTNSMCSDSYYVDDEEPIIEDLIITPDDDTMLIEIEASDKGSGEYKYYFSKDGGLTYIDSDNPNYTFTSLDEGDYIIVVYVVDKAGNKSETKAGSTTIVYADFCTHNDITNLSDCLLAMAENTTDVESARESIIAKGDPDFTATSPSIVYEPKISSSTSTTSGSSTYYYIGTGYTFDSSTGMFNITGGSLQIPSEIDYSSGDYYTCMTTYDPGNYNTVYKIISVSTQTNTTTGEVTNIFTVYAITQTPSSYDTSETGMYATSDNHGTTYYYRGSVGDNYVYFAGYYWRIIRINGDGSIRIIYDGTTAHSNGESSSDRQVTTKAFNSYYNDNTYIGYMYGDTSKFTMTDSTSNSTTTYSRSGISLTNNYYYSTSYELLKTEIGNGYFRLTNDNNDLISGTIDDSRIGLYTCWSTSETGTCQRLEKITTLSSSKTTATSTAFEWGTTSLEDARERVTNSTIKDYLDNTWYKNISNYEAYLSGSTEFCNNTEISKTLGGNYTNEGYGIHPTLYGYTRFHSAYSVSAYGPTLICQESDSYTVKDSGKGNESLTYPIGLITADEVNLAGGMIEVVNSLYYLFSGTRYWTISPSKFCDELRVEGFLVDTTGDLNGGNRVELSLGVRPVINIKAEKFTFTGSGTKEDPFVVT